MLHNRRATAVINASLAGVITEQLNPLYDRVLGGIHSIEGVLADQLYIHRPFRATWSCWGEAPSSALGTMPRWLKRDDEAVSAASPT